MQPESRSHAVPDNANRGTDRGRAALGIVKSRFQFLLAPDTAWPESISADGPSCGPGGAAVVMRASHVQFFIFMKILPSDAALRLAAIGESSDSKMSSTALQIATL